MSANGGYGHFSAGNQSADNRMKLRQHLRDLIRSVRRYVHASEPAPLVLNFGSAGSRVHDTGALVACHEFVQRDMDVTGLGFPLGVTPYDGTPARLVFEPLFHLALFKFHRQTAQLGQRPGNTAARRKETRFSQWRLSRRQVAKALAVQRLN